ncbi:MAG: FmdB family zinc ribbon protein [Gammaproteobacteria bacterium]
MPIYEYLCENCGHEFETLQKLSEAPLRDCPKCSTARLVKKVTAAGFRLKGGGWYETDFKGGSKRNVAGESGSSGPGNSGGNSAGNAGGGSAGADASGSASTSKGGDTSSSTTTD